MPDLRRPGLDPGPRFLFGDLSDQVGVKIEPVRIGLLDQSELPFAPPSLHALLVRNALLDRFAAFGPDETIQTISSAEIGTVAAATLEDALRQMRSHPNVHRAATTVSHDVDPTAATLPIPSPEKNRSGAPGQARGDGRRLAPSPNFPVIPHIEGAFRRRTIIQTGRDRKSTRLNSSH